MVFNLSSYFRRRSYTAESMGRTPPLLARNLKRHCASSALFDASPTSTNKIRNHVVINRNLARVDLCRNGVVIDQRLEGAVQRGR